MKDKICGIYCIENSINGKKYVGQSQNIKARWMTHRSELRHQHHNNDHLQSQWNKYGEENFYFYILEECQVDSLNNREIYYIEKFNTTDEEFGYNLKTGGQNCSSYQNEYVRQKQSNALKAYFENNKEARNNKRKNALLQWANPTIKNKILGKNNGMYGKHHQEEAKQKIRDAKMNSIQPKRDKRKIYCQELNRIFDCAYCAHEELNIQTSCILRVCYGKAKTTGGYHFQFYEENNI